MKQQKVAIIVAGGKGERMNASIPKQFLTLAGKPILMHTIEVFHRYSANIRLILVLPSAQMLFWNELCNTYSFHIPHTVVPGGSTRFYSVKNALDTLSGDALIAIHDGVRPLVDIDTINRCFEEAEKSGTAIPVTDLVDSIREVNDTESKAVDRNNFRLVQTPQVFKSDILLQSYRQPYSDLFTDDASVVESSGYKVHLVEGNPENIKITTNIDLKIAEIFLKL
ncbi:MAG: 2-C-methyl-D-erythritol 4-phosphate cytidylyltransferase [Bacteroidetes bacterium]|nr:2-C-methyl-D-erythritol 4-phosphate cytidylyltransferase [Bacteroidota bacterium]